MEQTVQEIRGRAIDKSMDLLQVAGLALERCTGDDTPAEQLIRLLLLHYHSNDGLLTPAILAEPLDAFRRQCQTNLKAARQIARLKPWLLEVGDADLAEELRFDLDVGEEPQAAQLQPSHLHEANCNEAAEPNNEALIRASIEHPESERCRQQLAPEQLEVESAREVPAAGDNSPKVNSNADLEGHTGNDSEPGVPNFEQLLGVDKHIGQLFEALWNVTRTPCDYTAPDCALVKSLLDTFARDQIITPKTAREDFQLFLRDFADCQQIAARMQTAAGAGVSGC